MFMPETGAGAPQTDSVGSLLTPATLDISSGDIALMQKVLSAASRNPNLIPSDFMAYIVDYIQTSRLQIPIGQVFGFTQFTAQSATTIATQESTNSTSYTDLTTPGPTLSGLPGGNYLILCGAKMGGGSAAFSAYMAAQVNAVTPADTEAAQVRDATFASASIATVKTLSASSNTVTAKYKSDGAGSTEFFSNRWLVALKYANL